MPPDQPDQSAPTVPTSEASVPPEISLEQIQASQDLILATQENEPNELESQERTADAEQTLRERETERTGREGYFNLRTDWSRYLSRFLGGMLFFQIVLTVLIGSHVLAFDDKPFLYVIVSENFLQIAGMCLLVVKFLFPSGIDK